MGFFSSVVIKSSVSESESVSEWWSLVWLGFVSIWGALVADCSSILLEFTVSRYFTVNCSIIFRSSGLRYVRRRLSQKICHCSSNSFSNGSMCIERSTCRLRLRIAWSVKWSMKLKWMRFQNLSNAFSSRCGVKLIYTRSVTFHRWMSDKTYFVEKKSLKIFKQWISVCEGYGWCFTKRRSLLQYCLIRIFFSVMVF